MATLDVYPNDCSMPLAVCRDLYSGEMSRLTLKSGSWAFNVVAMNVAMITVRIFFIGFMIRVFEDYDYFI